MQKTNILIAEDDNIISMEIQTRLEEKGFGVIGPYAYGEDVIKNIKKFDVDLILLDINLKGELDGIQTAHLIREKYRKPIIYLTAFTDKGTIERAKITEPFGYIVKPFEDRELFTNIEMALYKHKIECELIDSNLQYQELIELAVDGILLGSEDGYIINANSHFCLISGRDKEDLIGRHITDSIFSAKSLEKAPLRFDLLSKGETVVSERNILRPDGSEISVEMRTKIMSNQTYQSFFRDITDRKKIESTLRDSISKTNALLKAIPDMMFILDKKGIYLDYQAMDDSLLYASPDIFIGKSFWDVLPNEIAKEFEEVFNCAFETKKIQIHEYFLDLAGKRNYYEGRVIAIDNEQILTIIRNITDRRITDNKLKSSLSLLDASLEATADGILIVDNDGKISKWNKKFAEMWHLSHEILSNNDDGFIINIILSQLIYPDQFQSKIKFLYDNPHEISMDNIQFIDGRIFERYSSPQRIGDTIAGRVWSFRDITKEKLAEKSIISSEVNLKLLNTSLSDMLNVQDLSIIYQNIVNVLSEKLSNTVILCISIDENNKETKLESIAGINDTLFQSVINLSGFNIIGRSFKLLPSHNDIFRSGKLLQFEGSLVEFSGGEFPAIAALGISKLIGLNKIYSIGINKDDNLLAALHFFTLKNKEITEIDFIETFVKQTGTVIQKIMAQQALEQSQHELMEINLAKDKFFSIIAHDLKSPFNGFLGLTKIMSEEAQDLTIEEIKSFSFNLYKSANNLFSLLENLLEWSQMQRGIIEFNPKHISVSLILKQNLIFINELLVQKEINISNNFTQDIEVFADESMINSVLRNLLTNAIKFSHRGGRIEIGSCRTKSLSNKEICIFIRDNGIGIDSNTISRLFKLEEKVSRLGTEREPSTGLGLLLCKEFIDKNGGRIWVESEIGVSSTFFFTLQKVTQDD